MTQWMDTELQKTEDVRAQYRFDEDQRDLMTDLAIDKYEESALFPVQAARVISEADALLKDAGLPPGDHDSLDFKRLCRRLSLAQREVLGIEIERWQNIYRTHQRPTELSGEATTAPVPVAQPSPPTHSRAKIARTLPAPARLILRGERYRRLGMTEELADERQQLMVIPRLLHKSLGPRL